MAEGFWRVFFSRRMIVNLFFGFSSGLPLLLTSSALQAWMRDQGIDLKTVGLVALIGVPYAFKYLWSPIFDRFTLPFLGRRRGWILVIQCLLALSVSAMAYCDPHANISLLVCVAVVIAFLSASQDIVVDAYRRESLSDEELGLGSSIFVNGYRVGMLVASGLSLIIADQFDSWKIAYLCMAGFVGVGIITTFFAEEPEQDSPSPRNFKESVLDPFIEYFKRPNALWILAFILLYKLGDTLASNMTMPFYLDIGFTKTEIGSTVKLVGLWSGITGGLIGGALILKLGIIRALLIFGILQALTIPSFSVLALVGPNITFLVLAIVLETVTAAMGTSAYVAYMGSITNRKFTATQYALLSSVISVPRNILASPTGVIAQNIGYFNFFIFCALAAIPGLLLIAKIRKI